jgi:transcriptional accessory protein Tex/SPT6
LLKQQASTDPQAEAAKFVNPEKGVAEVASALAGARDIMAERVSDDVIARAHLARDRRRAARPGRAHRPSPRRWTGLRRP